MYLKLGNKYADVDCTSRRGGTELGNDELTIATLWKGYRISVRHIRLFDVFLVRVNTYISELSTSAKEFLQIRSEVVAAVIFFNLGRPVVFARTYQHLFGVP